MVRVRQYLSGPFVKTLPTGVQSRIIAIKKESHDAKHRSPKDRDNDSRNPTLARLWDVRARRSSYDQRTQLVNDEHFVNWLTEHLSTLARRQETGTVIQYAEDEGFPTFLRKLSSLLSTKNARRDLNSRRGQNLEKQTVWKPTEQTEPMQNFIALKEAFAVNGKAGVNAQLKYSYNGLVAGRNFSKADLDNQTRLLDLRYPPEWYPATREIERTIHLHVGPTNSGKTHQALKRLEESRTGLYAGPLRLLAHEVYTRLNAKGKTCDLVTGDEKRLHVESEGPRMMSCTVEMVPVNILVDVAVIDEIQMIGDEDRGWAWTQALLGVKAKELHLCGEARTVPLIRALVASMGDKLEVHTYKRLSPLMTMSTSLKGDLNNLRKGDCIVVFSVVGIHAMKSQVEQKTGKRVAIVYGSLPPEIRAQQAALFNDPHNDYDILVASDAIGMGLNLAIKRVIFETVTKFNGMSLETMHPADIKQIAGRAGRYRTAPQPRTSEELDTNSENHLGSPLDLPAPPSNLGLITTLEAQELPFVRRAMETEAEPIMTAGLLPPSTMLEDFARYFPPSISYSYVLLRLRELARLSPYYHFCQFKQQIDVADVIHPVKGLSTFDRNTLCQSPSHMRTSQMAEIMVAYARCVERNTRGELLSIPEIPLEVLNETVRLDREYLRRLETLHKALVLYIWLGYRVAGVFLDREMAFYVKKLTEEKIQAVLADFSASKEVRKRIENMKQQARRKVQKLNEAAKQSNKTENTTDKDLSVLLEKTTVDGGDQSPSLEVPEIGHVVVDEGGSSADSEMTQQR